MDDKFFFDLLKPVQTDDLIRVGSDYDGGYWITKSILKHTKTLIGLGVFVNWSFEEQFRHKSNCLNKTIVIDGSINKFFFQFYWIKAWTKFFYFTLKNPRYCSFFFQKHIVGSWQLVKKWQTFLEPDDTVFFEKFIDNFESKATLTADSIFSVLNFSDQQKENNIFVKMDIEGAEYRVLETFFPYFKFINGFAIEFHQVKSNKPLIAKLVQDLKSEYEVVFIHNNNYTSLIDDNFSDSIEITFLKKELIVSLSKNCISVSDAISQKQSVCNPSMQDFQPKY